MHIFYCTARKVFWGMNEPTTEIHPFNYVKGCTGFFSHGDDNTVMTKLPLASRMATFIRETTFELETLNSELQIYNEHLQDVAKTDAFYKLNARGKMR